MVPEVNNFLVNALLVLAPHSYEKASQVPGSFPISDSLRPELAALKIRSSKKEVISPRLDMTALLQSTTKVSSSALLSLLSTNISLLDRFSQLYVTSEAFVEIGTPLLSILQAVRANAVPSALQVSASPCGFVSC